MFSENKKVRLLEERVTSLHKLNAELRKKIDETRRLTAEFDALWEENKIRMNSYSGARGGSFGKIRNLKDFDKWKNTVFWKYRKELNLMGYSLGNLPERDMVSDDIFCPECNWKFEFSICAFCDMVLPTSQGPIVHIIDPFGEYTLPPAKGILNENVQKLTGSILLVKCNMQYYQKNYEVIGFEKLPYTLYEKM